LIEDTDNNNTSNPLEEKDNSVTPEQELKDEAWINAHKHQFYPTKVLNEETGMMESFLLSYCINCRYPEPSVLNYAEFSPTHGKLICKVTGRTPCDGKRRL
jgi:hypothetical protein